MPQVTAKSNKIRHIVRIRQMLLRWRKKAASRRSTAGVPSDVPSGHVAVCVGSSCRRFIVRATHLNHPVFRSLLVQAEEEYGFANRGPLALPCDESEFEQILQVVARSDSGRLVDRDEYQRCCHVGESGRLLKEFADESVF